MLESSVWLVWCWLKGRGVDPKKVPPRLWEYVTMTTYHPNSNDMTASRASWRGVDILLQVEGPKFA